ncbi:MAG: copper chaperone PCu(A)C [Chloroflexi bacterium]|nr:copper chaperone PCu(A)C [Chloroflexota bacterium]
MRKIILVFLVAILSACGTRAPDGPQIEIQDVWSRPAVVIAEMISEESFEGEMEHAMSGTGAVFMTLVNEGQENDRLVAAQTDVAETVEIHQTTMENDVMRMQQVAAIEIPAGGQVELEPGDYHIMLIGLHQDLTVGDRFSVTLTFEKSGTLVVEAKVRQP